MNENAPTGDTEYQLLCAEALLAGTLALMTGRAQARTAVRHCARGECR